MWQHTRESACYGIVIALQHAYRSSIMIGREKPLSDRAFPNLVVGGLVRQP
jgi:hypothetical protein